MYRYIITITQQSPAGEDNELTDADKAEFARLYRDRILETLLKYDVWEICYISKNVCPHCQTASIAYTGDTDSEGTPIVRAVSGVVCGAMWDVDYSGYRVRTEAFRFGPDDDEAFSDASRHCHP